MQKRLHSKLVCTLKDLFPPITRSIQIKTLSGAQPQEQARLWHLDAQQMSTTELHDLRERVMEAIQRKHLHS